VRRPSTPPSSKPPSPSQPYGDIHHPDNRR
jgi:hypothetical protein